MDGSQPPSSKPRELAIPFSTYMLGSKNAEQNHQPKRRGLSQQRRALSGLQKHGSAHGMELSPCHIQADAALRARKRTYGQYRNNETAYTKNANHERYKPARRTHSRRYTPATRKSTEPPLDDNDIPTKPRKYELFAASEASVIPDTKVSF